MLDVTDRHPGVQHFAHHFDHDHLPAHLATVSAPFHELAQRLVDQLPDNPELSSALRSLWDAKNSAVFIAAKNPDAVAAGRRPRRGMLVDYTLSKEDAAAINKHRADAKRLNAAGVTLASQELGPQIHIGNSVAAGDHYPMVITRPWGDTSTSSVNGQVLLDGNDAHWVTSTGQGDGERHWR